MAGLIGQDVLLIHDEAHLTPAFGHLIRQIIQTQYKQGNPRPLLPEEPAPDHLIDPDLIQMNQKYAVVRIGGKTRVVWFEEAAAYPGCKVSVFSTISDFCAFHAKRKEMPSLWRPARAPVIRSPARGVLYGAISA